MRMWRGLLVSDYAQTCAIHDSNLFTVGKIGFETTDGVGSSVDSIGFALELVWKQLVTRWDC